jgi:hypothetical protein
MMFVPVKNIEQQGILALHSARSLLVKQQTMLANAMRGLATEFGLTVPQGIGRLEELLALVDTDKAFPEKARQVFTGLFDQCHALAESIRAFEVEIVAHARPGSAWCHDSIPPAGRPAWVGSPKRATGKSAGCLSSVPPRWFTEPHNGRASSGCGPEGFWSAALSDW